MIMPAEQMVAARKEKYELPPLPYAPDALEPFISRDQLSIHHDKHHQAYVTGANADLERLDAARRERTDIDLKAVLKELSFNIGGHILHSLFWPTLASAGKGGGTPGGAVADAIDREFGSFDRFKAEFSKTASTVEGSGWAALVASPLTNRLQIMQIEKHNNHIYPTSPVLMVLDVWEHAYYIDYRNERGKFIESFWNIVNWDEVNRRMDKL
jgi:Fe-Mn family superoxide dismutase